MSALDIWFFIAICLYAAIVMLIAFGAGTWLFDRFKAITRFKGGRR